MVPESERIKPCGRQIDAGKESSSGGTRIRPRSPISSNRNPVPLSPLVGEREPENLRQRAMLVRVVADVRLDPVLPHKHAPRRDAGFGLGACFAGGSSQAGEPHEGSAEAWHAAPSSLPLPVGKQDTL